MSIESEITRITDNVASAYSEAEALGADVPAEANSDNLPGTLAAIPRATIVQATGSGTNNVMSQAAVTEELNALRADMPTKTSSLQVTFEVLGVTDDGMISISSDKTVAECIEAYKNGAAVYSMLDPTGNAYAGVMITYDESSSLIGFEVANTGDLSKRFCIAGMSENGVDTWLAILTTGATMIDLNDAVDTAKNALLGDATSSTASEATIYGARKYAYDLNEACKKRSVFYIEGNSTTAGTWTGTCDDITEYYDGLMIHYKLNVAGVSGGSTLNINGLGAVAVKRNATTAVTTTYAVGSVLNLTYTTTNGTPYWVIADYDANTKTSAGTSNKTAAKMFLVGATSQNSSGVTTYSNKNCYIGADNRLYSGGVVVPNVAEITALINEQLGVIENGTY